MTRSDSSQSNDSRKNDKDRNKVKQATKPAKPGAVKSATPPKGEQKGGEGSRPPMTKTKKNSTNNEPTTKAIAVKEPDNERETLRKQVLKAAKGLEFEVLAHPLHIHRELMEDMQKEFPGALFKADSRSHNPHARDAAYRLAAIQHTRLAMVGKRTHIVVSGIYPAPRESFTCYNPENSFVMTREARFPKILGNAERNTDTAEDHGPPDALFMVDVYAFGHTPATPEGLLSLYADGERPPPLYCITRRHEGEMGIVGTEIWMKDHVTGTPLVHSLPSPDEDMWPVHEPSQWLRWHGRKITHHGKPVVVVANLLRQIGPYQCVEVRIIDQEDGVVVPKLAPARRGCVEYVQINWTTRGDNLYRRLVPQSFQRRHTGWFAPRSKTVLCHTGVAASALEFSSRFAHGANIDSCGTYVSNEFKKNGFIQFQTSFPEKYEELHSGTSLAILYRTRAARSYDLEEARSSSVESDARLTRARMVDNKYTTPRTVKLLKLVLAVALTLMATIVTIGVLAAQQAPTPMDTPHLMVGDAGPGVGYGAAVVVTKDYVAEGIPAPLEKGTGLAKRKTRMRIFAAAALVHDNTSANTQSPTLLMSMAAPAIAGLLYVIVRGRRRQIARAHRLIAVLYAGMGATQGIMYEPTYGVGLPSVDTAYIPPVIGEIDLHVSAHGREWHHSEWNDLPVMEGRPAVWPLVYSTSGLFTPLRSLRNFVCALVTRTYAPHEQTPCEMAVANAAWVQVAQDAVTAGIFPQIDHIPSDDEIGQRRHGAKKRAWYAAAKSLYHLGRTALFGKRELAVSLKSNETIANKPNPLSDGLALKPRVLTTVSPESHVVTIPDCDAAKIAIARHWTLENVYVFRGRRVRLVYASSFNGEQRDKLMDAMLAVPDDIIVVAGDDSMTRIKGMWYTCDYSRYDSTQKRGVLILAANIWMPAMGFSDRTRKYFQSLYDSAFSTRFGPKFDFKVSGTIPLQFSTGLGLTTVGNGITNGLALLEVGSSPDRAAAFKRMGLVAKDNAYEEPAGMDFLKGWYVPATDGGYTYQPLPSRVLKLGKVSKDPTVLAKRRPHEWREAAQEVAAAMASGHPGVARNQPFIGDLLQLYDTFRPSTRHLIERNQVIENAEFSVTDGGGRTVSDDTWNTMLMNRYGITPEESKSFAALLACPHLREQFPVMINHPALDKLRNVDY